MKNDLPPNFYELSLWIPDGDRRHRAVLLIRNGPRRLGSQTVRIRGYGGECRISRCRLGRSRATWTVLFRAPVGGAERRLGVHYDTRRAAQVAAYRELSRMIGRPDLEKAAA